MKRLLMVCLCAAVSLSGCSAGRVDSAASVAETSKADRSKTAESSAGPERSGDLGKTDESQTAENAAPGFIKYNDVYLYEEAVPDKVCIRVEPPLIREKLSYYYIPPDEQQETLAELMDGLNGTWEKHDRRWEGKKESGWEIVYKDRKYDVFEGGYLYSIDTGGEDGSMEYLEQNETLCALIREMLEKELDYGYTEIADIHGIVSAALEMDGMRTDHKRFSQAITDPHTLGLFEEWLSGAEYIYGGAECGNQQACLELALDDGNTVKLSMATDSCPIFGLNGVYYDYRPVKYRSLGGWYSDDLFQYFDELPVYPPVDEERDKFSQEEIDSAVECVREKIKEFDEDWTFTDIWYEKEYADAVTQSYMDYGKGSVNGADADNVIILLSSFTTGFKTGSLEPNAVYADWKWILIRDSADSEWKVDDWGG